MLSNLKYIAPDPLFALQNDFLNDSNPDKINLGIGFYSDQQGGPFVFSSIQQASQNINFQNFNYDSIQGNKVFLKNFQEKMLEIEDDNLSIQQTCGGTHGLSLLATVLGQAGYNQILIGIPTWGNHFNVFQDFEIKKFNHLLDMEKVDISSYKEAIRSSEENSILLIQGGKSHNSTGFNISLEELLSLKELIESKNIFLIIDYAYFGLGECCDDSNVYVQKVLENFSKIAIVFSFSKCASLYKHRLGVILVKGHDKKIIENNLQRIFRRTVSNPPGFGAEVMNVVFDKYYKDWLEELEVARQDIKKRRIDFVDNLSDKFSYLKSGEGMFGLLGINEESIKELKNKYSIYMPNSSRVNFGGIKVDKIGFITDSIKEVI